MTVASLPTPAAGFPPANAVLGDAVPLLIPGQPPAAIPVKDLLP